VSDLHFGARNGLDDPALERAIGELVAGVSPDLVVASGDLTHRGRPAEHAAAAGYLRALGRPLLVVPGNHDIPTLPPARLLRPFAAFERSFGTISPLHQAEGLTVVGVCSVTPWGYQRGHVRAGELERAEARLRTAPPGAFRVVVLHHQLLGAPWRNTKLPVARRTRLLGRLAGAGAELVLGGHIHQAAVAERRAFEVVAGARAQACVLATAPGLGRPRPARAYEARGVLVHRADERAITVDVHVWRGKAFALAASSSFPRGSP
jgi:3',5'-cyclic AMP phosphodiesterase CpdA